MRRLLLLLVRFYQRFLRRLVGRRCVYRQSCSGHAVALLQDTDMALTVAVPAIVARVRGCGISAMTVARPPEAADVRDRRGRKIPVSELAPHVIERLEAEQARLAAVPRARLVFAPESELEAVVHPPARG